IRRLAGDPGSGLFICEPSKIAASFHSGHIFCDHFRYELRESDGVTPAKLFPRLRRIAEEELDFGWTKVPLINFDKDAAGFLVQPLLGDSRPLPPDLNANFGEGTLDELSDRMGFAGCQNVIVGLGLLHDAPHAFDIVACVSPIALGIQISQKQFVLEAKMD